MRIYGFRYPWLFRRRGRPLAGLTAVEPAVSVAAAALQRLVGLTAVTEVLSLAKASARVVNLTAVEAVTNIARAGPARLKAVQAVGAVAAASTAMYIPVRTASLREAALQVAEALRMYSLARLAVEPAGWLSAVATADGYMVLGQGRLGRHMLHHGRRLAVGLPVTVRWTAVTPQTYRVYTGVLVQWQTATRREERRWAVGLPIAVAWSANYSGAGRWAVGVPLQVRMAASRLRAVAATGPVAPVARAGPARVKAVKAVQAIASTAVAGR